MTLKYISGKASEFFKTERGKTILKWAQRIIKIVVLVWLVFQVSEIGWKEVWLSFPTEPLFYLLFIVLFFQLPLFEIFIYRLTWQFNAMQSFPIFLLKRVYNKDVLGYSGEIYFLAWVRNTLKVSGTNALKIIKDNNIISSVASTLMSIGLLSLFLFTDQLKVIKWIANQDQAYFVGGTLFLIILIVIFIKFRHHVISMPLKTAYQIFGIQTFRLLFVQIINLLMYYVVLPEVPFYIWFTYIAVEIILSRIPFLPNRDLIFAGMSISIAGGLPVTKEAIAGLMIARSVLNKIGSVAAFGLSSIYKKSDIIPDPDKNPTTFNKLSKTKDRKNS